jgi:hypothetical protein
VVVTCEEGNEVLGSITCGKSLDSLRYPASLQGVSRRKPEDQEF